MISNVTMMRMYMLMTLLTILLALLVAKSLRRPSVPKYLLDRCNQAFACAFTMFAGAALTDSADIKVDAEVVDTLVALWA